MEKVELKPCPFCGGADVEAYHHQVEGWEDSWHVECNAENCGNGTCHHETEAEAITAWNTRANDEEIARLVEAAFREGYYLGEGNQGRSGTVAYEWQWSDAREALGDAS